MTQFPSGPLAIDLEKTVDGETGEGDRESIAAVLARHAELRTIIGVPETVAPLSGLTNRVFHIRSAAGDFVLRLPRPENSGLIDRACEAHNLCLAADLGVAVAPVFLEASAGLLLTRAVRDVPAGERSAEALGRIIARLHRSQARFRGRIDPLELMARQKAELTGHPPLMSQFSPLAAALDHLETVADADAADLVPSHGDLSPGNVLVDDTGPILIDWEYSGMASPAWDLAYAILEHELSPEQERLLLRAYLAATGRDDRLVAEVERMKVRCDAVSALWALGQAAKANAATDFMAFAQARVARALRQFARLSGPA